MPARPSSYIPKQVTGVGSSEAAVTLVLCWAVTSSAGSDGEEGLSAQTWRLC